ncbi:MAG: MMPL family transporter [Cellvibrionaceae bacterium]|nr:MMPL family transporter [Cellvibrionaceae bacterium]
MFSRLFEKFLLLITTFPKITLAIVVLVVLAAAVGLPNFKLDASSDSLTLESDQDLDYFRETIKSYQSGDFLIVTFRPNDELFSEKSIDTLSSLKADLLDVEGIVSVTSMLDVPLLYSPKLTLTEIVAKPRTLLTEGVDYDMVKKEFMTSPVYKDLILGPDQQTTALLANLRVDETFINLIQQRDSLRYQQKTAGLTEAEALELKRVSKEFLDYRTRAAARNHARVAEIRAIAQVYRADAEIFVGGLTMITADMIRFIQNDLAVFGAAVLLFMVVVLAIIFRKLRFVVIPMITCLTAVLLMLGYVSWIDWRLTVISSNFVALLLIISLAITIHLVVRYREFAQSEPDWTQQELAVATAKYMARPCLYTVLTSVVAFASLVVSDIRPVIDFGWLMTMGLVLALVLAFIILPASLMLIAREQIPEADGAKTELPITEYFAKVVDRAGNVILLVALALAVVSAWGISRLQVENKFIDYFHSSTEIYRGLSVIDKNLGGTTSLDIIINAQGQQEVAIADDALNIESDDKSDGFGESDPFAEDDAFPESDPFADADAFDDSDPFSASGNEASDDPFAAADTAAAPQGEPASYWMTVAGLKQIEALHDYLESQPEIGKVQSLAILYKVGKDINGSLNNFELEVMQRALPQEVKRALISPFLRSEQNQTRISLRIHDTHPGLERAELVERIKNHIVEHSDLDIGDVRFTGLLVLYNNMLASLFDSQIVTLGLVFLGILIMFVILFRSLLVAVVAIIPNILAALSILGAMGIFGLPLDMMTITVAAISVGIGVDNTIHYIHRFRREIAVDGDYRATMHRAHGSIGRAMYYTSVIIIFGFSIMTLSEFIPTIYFGLLTGLAMFAALMGALLLLPQLLLVVKPFGKQPLEASEAVSAASSS